MKKTLFVFVLLCGLTLSAYAQLPTQQPIEQPRPKTTTLTADESKQLKAAIDLAAQAESEMKSAQDRLAARSGEAKALYWQFIVLKKIDIDKWQFSGFDEKGIATFVEKPPTKPLPDVLVVPKEK